LIENSKYHTEHNATLSKIKARLEKDGWLIEYLDNPNKDIRVFGTLPDLVCITPDLVLCYLEYKKKCWQNYFEYYEPARFLAYRELVNESNIPLLLIVTEGKSELLLP
jgi:hypothetical protein